MGGWTGGLQCHAVCLLLSLPLPLSSWVEVAGKLATEPFSAPSAPPALLGCVRTQEGGGWAGIRSGAVFLVLLCFLWLQGVHPGEACDFGMWALNWENGEQPKD